MIARTRPGRPSWPERGFADRGRRPSRRPHRVRARGLGPYGACRRRRVRSRRGRRSCGGWRPGRRLRRRLPGSGCRRPLCGWRRAGRPRRICRSPIWWILACMRLPWTRAAQPCSPAFDAGTLRTQRLNSSRHPCSGSSRMLVLSVRTVSDPSRNTMSCGIPLRRFQCAGRSLMTRSSTRRTSARTAGSSDFSSLSRREELTCTCATSNENRQR